MIDLAANSPTIPMYGVSFSMLISVVNPLQDDKWSRSQEPTQTEPQLRPPPSFIWDFAPRRSWLCVCVHWPFPVSFREFVCVSVHLYFCLWICMCIRLSISLSFHLLVHAFFHGFLRTSVLPSVCASIHSSVSPSVCINYSLSIFTNAPSKLPVCFMYIESFFK